MAKLGKLALEQTIYSVIAELVTNKTINISGGAYFPETRPHDSQKEDAIVVVSTATAEQIQEGYAKINLFVADINNGGRKVPNITRLRQLEQYDEVVVSTLNSKLEGWHFDRDLATDTIAQPETSEHFININLSFKRTTF